MGIFSLFGKKDGQPPSQADREADRKKRSGTHVHAPNTTIRPDGKPASSSPQIVKRKVAGQATAMKIDAIESEMSSEFMKYTTSGNTLPGPPPQTIVGKAHHTLPQPEPKPDAGEKPKAIAEASPQQSATKTGTLSLGTTTQLLMSETYSGVAALSVSESVPVIEEAAILYANAQAGVAEQMLRQAIEESHLGDAAMTVWNMLFDLYMVTGQRNEFEQLSIAFANKFETSPPGWVDVAGQQQGSSATASSAVPVVHFPTKLDASIVKQLERVQNLAASHRTLRLEFARVAEVNPVGCGILLNVLTRLQKSGNDLILVGSHELAAKIRTIIQVGRRDETEAPWLLLLEILRLLNLEKDFEEASIDYCVTFEVSPPAFVAPQNKVTTAIDETPEAKVQGEHFAMPAVIEGKTDELVKAVAEYAKDRKPAVLDCRHLTRVDFGAAGQLLTGFAPLTANGAHIELHNVNHLVTALFRIIGLSDLVRVLPRKV